MGTNLDSMGWPDCGQVDIKENIGSEPLAIHSSMHGPGYSGHYPLPPSYSLPGKARFTDGFHTDAVEWEPGEIIGLLFLEESSIDTKAR
jgi:beta-glucanase (GH16 family)